MKTVYRETTNRPEQSLESVPKMWNFVLLREFVWSTDKKRMGSSLKGSETSDDQNEKKMKSNTYFTPTKINSKQIKT